MLPDTTLGLQLVGKALVAALLMNMMEGRMLQCSSNEARIWQFGIVVS